MDSQRINAHLNACRRFAMEQNKKLFEKANTLNRSAINLLDRPDLDSEMFLQYLQLRRKADAQFREALDHLSLINEQFPALSNEPETFFGGKQVAFAPPTAQERSDCSATGETITVPAFHPRMEPNER